MSLSLATTDGACGAPDAKASDYYDQALKYLQGSTTAKGIISALESAEADIEILVQKNCFPMFVHAEVAKAHGYKGGLVVWDPTGKITAHGKEGAATFQSPAIALAHELGHAAQWINKKGWYLAAVSTVMSGDGSKKGSEAYKAKMLIENDNISTHETKTAAELGEGTRKNYEDAANFTDAKKNYKAPYALLPLGH